VDRQNRLLTALATILLVLVAILVFGRQDADIPADPDAPAERALFEGLERDTAVSLSIRSGERTISFTKRDGTWVMTEPKEMAVDERRVTEIVDRFASLKVQEQGFDGALDGFGLDEANRITVTIGAGEGKTFTAHIGRDAPVGYRSYVAGDTAGPALLASSKVGDLVRRAPDDFRSREVWKVSTATARRVRIDDASGSVVLRKDDHGWWLGDDGHRASDTAVQDWLSQASFLRADSFLDEADPASLGLAPATSTLTVEDDAGTHTLELGTRDEVGVAARGGGQTVRLGSDAAGLVRTTGWASDALLPVRRAQVDSIEIKLGDKTTRLTRTDGVWKDATGAETDQAERWLDTLADAKADRETPVDAPTETWGSVSLSEGTTRTETVTIGQELPSGGRAAKDAAGGPGFRIPPETLATLTSQLP
jgi:hypothetical protein